MWSGIQCDTVNDALINWGGFVAIARWVWGTVVRWLRWWLRKLVLDRDGILHPIHKQLQLFIKNKNIDIWKQSSLQIPVQLNFLCMYWWIAISTLIQFLWLGSYVFEKSVSCLNSYNFLTFAVADWKSFLISILLC